MQKTYDSVGWEHLRMHDDLDQTKKRKPHQYLGIFLSTEGLSKPSLARAQLDVQFFTNFVLKKTISDKQFSYLVSVVFHLIVAYKTQFSFASLNMCVKWDTMICKGLKFKSGLLFNFLNYAIHHSFLYDLKSFEQVQAENKSTSVVSFANSVGILGHLFVHKLHDLQVLSWRPFGLPSVLKFCEFEVVYSHLLKVDSDHLFLFMDGFLNGLDTLGIKAGAVVFFEDINLNLGVEVSELVSSTMTELQAIALVLECVPSSCLINLFLNSQTALDVCKSELRLIRPDFRNQCWIECCHIANVIHQKNLDVNWVKVRGHSGVLGNEQADAFTGAAALSNVHLFHIINEHFFRAGGAPVSSNARHFIHGVFQSIHRAYWEVGSNSWVLVNSLHANVDWFRSFLVWHLNLHLAAGFISTHTAGLWMYFMKTLHHHLPVAVHKRLYNRGYFSVICLFCSDVEISDHVFLCPFDVAGHTRLVEVHVSVWEGFVFNKWYRESVAVFKDFKIAIQNIVAFVCEFCLVFHNDIWLVHAKHWAVMEKNGIILHNGSVPISVSGFFSVLSANVVRLLGIADVFGVGFGFHKSCLFFAGISDVVSVHIST
ncbi:hypothetical protein G9A89_008265 [Geosiphon pyriformis]|nr:hypothetical protein G9A89_008265 [Geosiphon pyriformis]